MESGTNPAYQAVLTTVSADVASGTPALASDGSVSATLDASLTPLIA